MELVQIVNDFAVCIKQIDSRSPQAQSTRTGQPYQPGIGPHQEAVVVALVVDELVRLRPDLYANRVSRGVSYPGQHRQKCDLCIGQRPNWEWAVDRKSVV